MGWKKLISGEKMPDKDDPKYEKRYKKEVEAGRKAARFLRIDKSLGVRNALPASIRSGFSVSCSHRIRVPRTQCVSHGICMHYAGQWQATHSHRAAVEILFETKNNLRMMITDRINFRQPKYVLPAILYPLLLVTGYLVMDIFDTEVAETPSACKPPST